MGGSGARSASFHLGRLLQGAGLVMLPLGLYFGVVHDQGMTTELTLMVAGAASFLLGSALLRPHAE